VRLYKDAKICLDKYNHDIRKRQSSRSFIIHFKHETSLQV